MDLLHADIRSYNAVTNGPDAFDGELSESQATRGHIVNTLVYM